MKLKALPLLLAVVLGIVVGFWASAADWSTATRIAAIAPIAVALVLIGTPFALLRRRTLLPPLSGRAEAAGWELHGVYSEFPVGHIPEGLWGPSSDPALLLPVIRPDSERLHGAAARLNIEDIERATDRVLLLSIEDEVEYLGRLSDIPHDVTIWPGSRPHLMQRLMGRARRRGRSSPADRSLNRVIDHAV